MSRKWNKRKKNYIYDKIIPILPQDIIGGLIFDLIIENKYNEIDKPNNINEFLDKSLNEENKFNKFNIIYTFSELSEQFDLKDDINNLIDIEMKSSIKSESNLEIILKNFYSNKNQEFKVFKIHANSVEDIIYLRTFIKFFEDAYKYNIDYNNECDGKKYIFTVHILRTEIKNQNKNKIENKTDKSETGNKNHIESKNKSKNKKYKNNFNSISFTSNDVQHLFIDNLNGNDITLKDIKESREIM